MKKKSCKAQITPFILIGIIVLSTLAIYFYLQSSAKTILLPKNIQPIESFTNDCLKTTVAQAVSQVSLSGGYYPLPQKTTPTGIPYYFIDGETKVPSLQTIEQSIADFTQELLPYCTNNFVQFSDLLITQQKPKVTVKIEEENIIITANYPLTVTAKETTYNLKTFQTSLAVEIPKLHKTATVIVQDQEKNPQAICLSCISELAEKNELVIDVDEVAPNEIIITLINNKTQVQADPFVFAIKLKNAPQIFTLDNLLLIISLAVGLTLITTLFAQSQTNEDMLTYLQKNAKEFDITTTQKEGIIKAQANNNNAQLTYKDNQGNEQTLGGINKGGYLYFGASDSGEGSKILKGDYRIGEESQTHNLNGINTEIPSQGEVTTDGGKTFDITTPKDAKIEKEPKKTTSENTRINYWAADRNNKPYELTLTDADKEFTLQKNAKTGPISHDGEQYFVDKENKIIKAEDIYFKSEGEKNYLYFDGKPHDSLLGYTIYDKDTKEDIKIGVFGSKDHISPTVSFDVNNKAFDLDNHGEIIGRFGFRAEKDSSVRLTTNTFGPIFGRGLPSIETKGYVGIINGPDQYITKLNQEGNFVLLKERIKEAEGKFVPASIEILAKNEQGIYLGANDFNGVGSKIIAHENGKFAKVPTNWAWDYATPLGESGGEIYFGKGVVLGNFFGDGSIAIDTQPLVQLDLYGTKPFEQIADNNPAPTGRLTVGDLVKEPVIQKNAFLIRSILYLNGNQVLNDMYFSPSATNKQHSIQELIQAVTKTQSYQSNKERGAKTFIDYLQEFKDKPEYADIYRKYIQDQGINLDELR